MRHVVLVEYAAESVSAADVELVERTRIQTLGSGRRRQAARTCGCVDHVDTASGPVPGRFSYFRRMRFPTTAVMSRTLAGTGT
jgi:hypothetical protein